MKSITVKVPETPEAASFFTEGLMSDKRVKNPEKWLEAAVRDAWTAYSVGKRERALALEGLIQFICRAHGLTYERERIDI